MPEAPRLDVSGRPTELRPVDLERFFRPRRVAVVGASDTPRRPNTAMYRKIRGWAAHHGADVVPVNPNRDEIDGVTCHADLSSVPDEIDVAAILVGQPLGILEEAISCDIGFAVIFAAGFAEVGGEGVALQERLEELVADSDIRVLGPNTNLNAFEIFDDLPGPAIALITQSGHQGRPIFQAQELGIAMSHWAPTGNEVDLEFADFAAWFARRPEVGVIAAYIEGFKDGRTLLLAADRAAKERTPIVCVKVGRTEEGQSMARSHTGHLTGADDVVSAAFRQYGITRVDGLDELQDTAMMLARAAPPKGDGVCIYAISGGTGAHMADMAAAAGLRLPELAPGTQKDLHQWIPEYLRVSNPVDNGGAPSADARGRKILDAIVADPNVDLVICPITGALASLSMPLARDLVAVAETTDKPICVIWGSPSGTEEAYRDVLVPSGLPVFRTFGNCVQAVRAYFDHHAFLERYRSPWDRPPLRASAAAAASRARLRTAAGRSLSEAESTALLAEYGIPVTRGEVATSAAAAARAAEAIGFPVVMKVSSPQIEHKSDLGLVEVGVTSPTAARRTFRRLVERARASAPDAGVDVDGVLVAEMITGGTECVVGMSHDDLFGPVVMFGLGGVLIEALHDVTFRVPPFDTAEARRMIHEVKAATLLGGVRGRPVGDVPALADTLVKVQRLALELADDLAELDINPLVVRPKGHGVVALDALAIAR